MKSRMSGLAAATIVSGILLAAPALAGGMAYNCTIKQTAGPGGWVSRDLTMVFDGQGSAKIVDDNTRGFKTAPRPVRVRQNGDALKLRWSYGLMFDVYQNPIPSFIFSGTLDTKTGKIKVRGKPQRYSESVRGNGTCALRKNLSDKEVNRLLRG